MKNRIITSGYFIWLHQGHVELFENARALGDELIVIHNNDNQQILKYGKIIVPFKERKKVLESIRWVDKVVESIDEDRTVCKSLAFYKSDVFAKGGDRYEGEWMNNKRNGEVIFYNKNGSTELQTWDGTENPSYSNTIPSKM